MTDLMQKGAVADLGAAAAIRGMTVTMGWKTKADFDLGAVYEKKDGSHGLIYFGNIDRVDKQGFKQGLDAFPWMLLSGDAGVGDTEDEGGNEEELKIASLVDFKNIHLVAWDYGALQKGEGARFQGSGLQLKVVDEGGQEHQVTFTLAEGDLAPKDNVCLIATLDNSSPDGAKLVNASHTARFEGLKSTEQFWEFVQSARAAL